MMWHFPQMENSSSIRVNDYKLVRQYGPGAPSLSLYQLYERENGKTVRVDIEEAHNLADEMPEKTAELDALLSAQIKEKGGRIPHGNPTSSANLPGKENAPVVLSHQQTGNKLELVYRNNGAELVFADLIYSPNNGREWLRAAGAPTADDRVLFELPEGTSHYFVNLIDENNFMAIYPPIDRQQMQQAGLTMVDAALFAGYPEAAAGAPIDRKAQFVQRTTPHDRTVLAAFDFGAQGIKGLHTAGEGLTLVEDGSGPLGGILSLQEMGESEPEWMPLVNPSSIPRSTD